MIHNALVAETLFPVLGWIAASGGSNTGAFVGMTQYDRVGILVEMSGSGAGPVVLTINQATDISGTGAKVLPVKNVTLYGQDGTAVGVHTEQDSETVTLTGTDTTAHFAIVEVYTEDLDINGGFTHINASDGANAGKTTSCTYLCAGSRKDAAYSNAPA